MKYKIIENTAGEFAPMIQCKEEIGMLWWSKTHIVWRRCDRYGYSMSRHRQRLVSPVHYKSLKKAKKVVNRWMKGKQTHLID